MQELPLTVEMKGMAMTNIIRSTTQMALLFVSQYMKPGSVAVDATCGNGNDTAALAQMGAARIYAFDIQPGAVENTRGRLQEKDLLTDQKIHLIVDSHEKMGKYIKEKVDVILFNLGYLPSASKQVTTQKETTMIAVKESLNLLRKGGLLCITMYSGHHGGLDEKKAVLTWAEALDKKEYHAVYINMLNQPDAPPEILLVTLK